MERIGNERNSIEVLCCCVVWKEENRSIFFFGFYFYFLLDLYEFLNMIDEDKEEGDGRRWIKVKKVRCWCCIIRSWRHALSYGCHLKRNQMIKQKKSNGLN